MRNYMRNISRQNASIWPISIGGSVPHSGTKPILQAGSSTTQNSSPQIEGCYLPEDGDRMDVLPIVSKNTSKGGIFQWQLLLMSSDKF